ncbi:MAG: hypothetical protein VW644_11605, partial [Alphaproteobacteria bacterium]
AATPLSFPRRLRSCRTGILHIRQIRRDCRIPQCFVNQPIEYSRKVYRTKKAGARIFATHPEGT